MFSAISWISETFGPTGILATLLVVRFPKVLTGAFQLLKGGLGGIANMLSGGSRGSYSNPMYVQMVGGSGPGSTGEGGFTDMLRSGKKGGPGRNMLARLTKMSRKGGIAGKAAGFVGKAGNWLSKGVKLGGPLGLLGIGADIGRGFLDDPDSNLGKGLGIAGRAASYAGMGAFLGPIGAAVGGLAGLVHGVYDEYFSPQAMSKNYKVPAQYTKSGIGGGYGSKSMMDGRVSPSGNVITTAKGELWRTAPGDYITVSQPGGGSGMGGNINLNISGTIKLTADGTTIDISELVKDPEFRREATKIIVNQMKTGSK
jgi:hypothetical protein